MKTMNYAKQTEGAAHYHVVQAHHSGMIIGFAAGSTIVTLTLAIAYAVSNPGLLFHPADLRSQLTVPQTTQTVASPGEGSQAAAHVRLGGAAASAAQH